MVHGRRHVDDDCAHFCAWLNTIVGSRLLKPPARRIKTLIQNFKCVQKHEKQLVGQVLGPNALFDARVKVNGASCASFRFLTSRCSGAMRSDFTST